MLGNLEEVQKISKANIEATTKVVDTLTKATQVRAPEE